MTDRTRTAEAAAPSAPHIVIAGEALIDLIDQGDGVFRAVPGGSAVNVAVAIAQLGRPVELLARIGRDAMSQQIRHKLEDYGVSTTYAVDADELTTMAVASLDEDAHASYSFYINGTADWQWTEAELPATDYAPAALHIGSIALSVSPGAEVLAAYAARLHAADTTTVSLDPNIRLGLGRSASFEAARVLGQVPHAHIVKASDDDLRTLYPTRDPAELIAEWAETYGIHTVLTLGDGGVLSFRPSGASFAVPARAPRLLTDTVGAGDTFWGAMLDRLAGLDALGSQPAGRLAALSDQQWLEMLRFGVTAASLVCERAGAQPPLLDEVIGALEAVEASA